MTLGAAVVASSIEVATAQTVSVPNAATCLRCSVVAETLFTVGKIDADMLAPNSQLVRDDGIPAEWRAKTAMVGEITAMANRLESAGVRT